MSKIIFDEPKLLDETLVSLTEACKLFPRTVARPTIERWLRKGSRGVKLESVLVAGRRMVSVEAVNRFIRNQLHTEPEKAPPQRTMPKANLAAASRKYNLPEPD